MSRIRMGWVALWFALGLFSIGFIAFLFAAFYLSQPVATVILGVIDGILAWTLRRVYSFLFPER